MSIEFCKIFNIML